MVSAVGIPALQGGEDVNVREAITFVQFATKSLHAIRSCRASKSRVDFEGYTQERPANRLTWAMQ